MKKTLSISWKIYKILFLLYTLAYWIGIVIDDWVFIEKYWATNWDQYIRIWLAYFLIYSLFFSFIFWSIAGTTTVIYQKIFACRKQT